MAGNQDIVVNMLQELNKKVDGISKETTENSTMLRGLNNCMYGKGSNDDGLINRFNHVEKNQEHCRDGQKSRKVDTKWIVAIVLSIAAFLKDYIARALIFLILCILTGCATYTIRDSKGQIISQGETTGIMRTITVSEKYNDSGKCIERKISTDSNTKEVLMGLNEFIDTAVQTAEKIKP